jgi:Tfp pilus assembly protein PilW
MRAFDQAGDCGSCGMLTMNSPRRARAGGFSLVELMVALVVGLFVVGAVLALVLAIMKSNRQTLQSTRLNQELRATMGVVINDLRRARGTEDPLTEAKLPPEARYGRKIDYSQAGCIRYAYANAPGGSCHVIVRATTGVKANRIFLLAAAPDPTAGSAGPPVVPAGFTCNTSCPTDGAGGTQLGSDQVAITAMTFTPKTPTSPTDETVRSFDVTITGNLIDQDAELNSISRTITESVQIRSLGAGN